MNITIGHDAEVFVEQGGEPVPICGLIGGEKGAPIFSDTFAGAGILEDNVMAELNPAPATNAKDFIANTKACMDFLSHQLGSTGVKLLPEVSEVEFTNLMDPRAWLFGCSSVWDAYTGEEIKSPELDSTVRFAGGHIHVGFGDLVEGFSLTAHTRRNLIKLMDAVVGTAMVQFGDNTHRKNYYGMAGSYRPTSYGVEYRVPDNSWLWSSHRMITIFHLTRKVAKHLPHLGKLLSSLEQEDSNYWEVVRKCINSGDKDVARSLQQMLKHKGI